LLLRNIIDFWSMIVTRPFGPRDITALWVDDVEHPFRVFNNQKKMKKIFSTPQAKK
jgi:hypothetical protein